MYELNENGEILVDNLTVFIPQKEINMQVCRLGETQQKLDIIKGLDFPILFQLRPARLS
jgi:hypothetical protein